MSRILIIPIVLFLTLLSSCSIPEVDEAVPNPLPEAIADPKPREPVLVELFTSEGCSSCPPADRELERLETQQPVVGAEVITLAFHVDYWDSPSWRDAFSSAEYSERQNQYVRRMKLSSSYTPQMIIDGQVELVGSDARSARDLIGKSSSLAKGEVRLEFAGPEIRIVVSGLPKHDAATIYLAAAEDQLKTKVRGGENGGRELSHISVVRALRKVAAVPADSLEYSLSAIVPTKDEWKTENLKYVAFIQEDLSGKVLAAGRIAVSRK